MDAKELSCLIKTRIVVIGNALKHLESIAKYAKQNKQFADAFSVLYFSLQNTVYIELFKLFDDGKDAKKHNIYTLINLIEDDKKTYHRMLSVYKKDIDSIENRRNSLYGHELGKNGADVYRKYPINHRLQDLLQCISWICCEANDEPYPNTITSNSKDFDEWCRVSLEAKEEICNLHDKIFTTTRRVSLKIFYEHLDDYLVSLDQKCEEDVLGFKVNRKETE